MHQKLIFCFVGYFSWSVGVVHSGLALGWATGTLLLLCLNYFFCHSFYIFRFFGRRGLKCFEILIHASFFAWCLETGESVMYDDAFLYSFSSCRLVLHAFWHPRRFVYYTENVHEFWKPKICVFGNASIPTDFGEWLDPSHKKNAKERIQGVDRGRVWTPGDIDRHKLCWSASGRKVAHK